MKQLFVLGILGICFGGSCFAFAKASSLPTLKTHRHAQQSSTNEIYQKLDAFIEAPNLKNGASFYKWLASKSFSTKEEQLAQVISLSNLGFFATADGDNQKAIQYYAEGWNIYNSNQLSGFDILQSCLKPLGNLYTQSNALSEAQQIIEIYILRAQEAKRTDIIPGGIANLSIVYQNQGNYEKAISLLEQGLKRHSQNSNLLTNLATNLFAVDRYEEGLKVAQQSLAIHPNQPNMYKMRAQLYASKKQYTEAVQELKQAYKLLQNNPRSPSRDLAKTQLALAEIYVQQNQLETAKLALKRVYKRLLQNSVPSFDPQQDVPEVDQLYPENTLMDALDLHAHIATLENDSRLGVQLYEHAAYVGMLLNTAQRNQQSRLIMQSNIKRRVAAYLALTHALYLEEKDPTILEKAFLMSQKATASIVSETYLSKKQRQPYRDDALCIDLEQREKKQANWKVEVYENQKLGIPNPLEYAAILDSIDQNGFQIKTIQNRLRQKYPALNETHEIVLSEVQSKARKKGQTVVSYFMGTTASYQFVISGNEVTFNRLSSGAKSQELFKQECIQFISYFRDAGRINNDPSGYTKAAFLLFKKLNLPDTDALIIIPDSFLQFIPFDALLTKESKGFQYENMPFLLHESRVSYALSPLLYLEEDIPMVTRPLALGVFPVFEGTPLELTHSVEEARALEDSFDGTLLMHEEASSASAFAKAGTHQILHFSTHASGGTLRTPAYLQLYDARIPVNQLYGDQWQTDLVVLSACETGIGAIISGEGAQSLARGFQYAGVQNIAFTLWQVNDRSTATLMSTYYQNLNKTRSRNESLQAAKKNYLADSSIPNTKKSPYYWAAFVYYGTTDVSQSYNSWMWWCGLGILVLFLIFLLKRKHGITA